MSHSPCSRCAGRIAGKACNGYVSWYPFENERVSYYCSWGPDCFAEDILPTIATLKEQADPALPVCVMCGESVDPPVKFVFLTLFPPKMEQKDYEFPACPESCFLSLQQALAKGGRFIPDRNARDGAGAQAPSHSDQAWAGMNL